MSINRVARLQLILAEQLRQHQAFEILGATALLYRILQPTVPVGDCDCRRDKRRCK
jgi:hypothetical protein